MKFRSFSRFVEDAFKNIFRNRIMSLATVITLSAGLFLFGLSTVISLNVFAITKHLQTEFKLSVYIEEGTEAAAVNRIGTELQSIDGVVETEFISKQQAYEDFKERYGETEILEGIDDGSILRDSYKVTLANLEMSKQISAKAEEISGVANVAAFDDAMGRFLNVSSGLQIGTICISIVLALLAMLIITNTINMSIFNRRKQINIMKYVGATDWYIRWPFIIEGILIGIISAVVSFLCLYFLYDALVRTVGVYSDMIGLLQRGQTMVPSSCVISLLGVLLGFLGSMFSVRKHLNV